MREVVIQLNGLVCEAKLCDGKRNVLSETKVELDGPTNWLDLLVKVGAGLKLMEHAPPGLVTEGDQPADKRAEPARQAEPIRAPLEAWVPSCGGFGMPGWGWGFYLPCLTETCCGFRDLAAAAKAAKCLRHNLGTITELPNGVFEVFVIDGVYAFLDLHGEVHASFPTREEARGCAGKLEVVQMTTRATPNSIPG